MWKRLSMRSTLGIVCVSHVYIYVYIAVITIVIINWAWSLLTNHYICVLMTPPCRLVGIRNNAFMKLLAHRSAETIALLLLPLYRGGNLFWNQTVNKMTANVLRKLRVSSHHRCCGDGCSVPYAEAVVI